MKTGMTANYIATASDHIVKVAGRANNLWVEIDGLRIQIMRDGTDEEPEVCVDVWDAKTLDAGSGEPLVTASVNAQTKKVETKVW